MTIYRVSRLRRTQLKNTSRRRSPPIAASSIPAVVLLWSAQYIVCPSPSYLDCGSGLRRSIPAMQQNNSQALETGRSPPLSVFPLCFLKHALCEPQLISTLRYHIEAPGMPSKGKETKWETHNSTLVPSLSPFNTPLSPPSSLCSPRLACSLVRASSSV